MVRLIAPCLIAALAACASAPLPPETPTGPHFKVLTFNVNYGGPGADLALAAISEEDADLVCLQETTPDWVQVLRAGLQDRYAHVDFHHSRGAGGQAVFSKFPMKRIDMVPSPVEWFPAGIYTVETPVGPVQLFNLHLHPGVTEEGSFTPRAYLSTAPDARLKEIRAYYERRDPALPALMIGDFNEGDSGSVVQWLGAKGLKDALPKFDSYTKTWHWETSIGITVKHRLDHLLYSAPLHCLEARVVQKGESDHYPVIAVFESRR